MQKTNVGGVLTVIEGRAAIASCIARKCNAVRTGIDLTNSPLLVFSSNGQGLALLGKNKKYDSALREADIVHADGMSIVFASRLFTNKKILERSATTDMFYDITNEAIKNDLSFFVLGGAEELNNRSVDAMRNLYPNLRIVGRHHGYFSAEENDSICSLINETKPDILWVGLGKPYQEVWCHQNRDKLSNVGCIKTCGGLFSFLTGDAKRAPIWMQKFGLEWLFRLLNDPQRLFVRYFLTNIKATYRMIVYSR